MSLVGKRANSSAPKILGNYDDLALSRPSDTAPTLSKAVALSLSRAEGRSRSRRGAKLTGKDGCLSTQSKLDFFSAACW